MDGGYCTYPLYQIGRLFALSGDPEVLKVMDELCRWVCYCALPTGEGRWVGPTSWNGRSKPFTCGRHPYQPSSSSSGAGA